MRDNKFTIRHANGELNLLSGEIVKVIRARFAREDIYASCLTCKNMYTGHPGVNYCTKYQTTPPLTILVNSCGIEGYDDVADIPY